MHKKGKHIFIYKRTTTIIKRRRGQVALSEEKEMFSIQNIIQYFPQSLGKKIEETIKVENEFSKMYLEEIRVRVARPVILKIKGEEKQIDYIPTKENILEIIQHVCDNSIYSFQNQICQGFITIPGGHRVGIVGNVVIKEGKVVNISYIAGINFRIAKQILGCSTRLMKYILNVGQNTIYDTLLVSPPRCRENYYFKRLYSKN